MLLSLIMAGLVSVHAQSQFNILDYYHPIGPTESLVASFDHSTEATTENQYSGLLLIDMSGTGHDNNYSQVFDPFYLFGNGQVIGWTPAKNASSLRIAFDGNTAQPGPSYYIGDNTDIDPLQSLYQIRFNQNVGSTYDSVNYYAIPTYNASHDYQIVLDIDSLNPRTLNFGFGGMGNTGQYKLSITPLDIGVVPEPSTGLLLLVGFGVTLLRRK